LIRYSVQGDANLDRAVGFADVAVVGQNYQSADKYFFEGDFNYDGTVDFADMVVLAQAYGTTLPPAPAPAADRATSLAPVSDVLAAARPREASAGESLFGTVPVVRPRPVAVGRRPGRR